MAKTKTQKPKPVSKASKSAAKLSWLPKKTFELEFAIAWMQVKKHLKQP